MSSQLPQTTDIVPAKPPTPGQREGAKKTGDQDSVAKQVRGQRKSSGMSVSSSEELTPVTSGVKKAGRGGRAGKLTMGPAGRGAG